MPEVASLKKGWHRPGIGFLTFLMEGEGLGSLQVSALFWCLELHKYHLPRLACCQVSHHCLVTGRRRPSET